MTRPPPVLPALEAAAPPAPMRPPPLAVDALLRSYSQVLLSGSRGVGAALLAATMLVPEVGLAGLLGAASANGLGAALGLDRGRLRRGLLGYDGLLVGLVLGATFSLSPGLALAVVGGGGLALVLAVALGRALRRAGLPPLSLAFVLATWATAPAVGYLPGGAPRRAPATALLDLPLPGLDALGAIFALPHAAVGLVVLVALLAWSRIAAVHAATGAAVASALLALLVDLPPGASPVVLRFNAVLAAVALGGVFLVPGPGSLAVAAGGALLAGGLSVGLGAALGGLGWPVLALPFNLAVLLVLAALAWRRPGARPLRVVAPGSNPEDTLRRATSGQRRFGRTTAVPLRLPFTGAWVVTQGNDGAHTHQGPWRHGLDFEVVGPDGRAFQGAGDRVTDFHCYGRPVTAMAPGTVVAVVDGLPDSPPGRVDAARPWGNVVVVQHAPACFSLVAHLQPRSIRVKPGEVVAAGQVLARCGASGRAAVPHLHVQLQAQAAVGAPTLPIAFHGGVVGPEGAARVAWEACPSLGDSVAPRSADPALVAALDWAPGARLRLETREAGRVAVEEVRCEIDALGGRSLWAPATGARLSFCVVDGVFTVLDVRGPRSGGLFALGLALSRVPLSAAALSWVDHLDPGRLQGPLARMAREALAAVAPAAPLALQLRGRVEGGGLLVEGAGPGLRTTARVQPGPVVTATVALGDRRLELSCTSC